jgi:hypothetical protein
VNDLQDIDKDIETIWKELQVNEKMNRICSFFNNKTEINDIFFSGTGCSCLLLGSLKCRYTGLQKQAFSFVFRDRGHTNQGRIGPGHFEPIILINVTLILGAGSASSGINENKTTAEVRLKLGYIDFNCMYTL